MNDRSEQQEPGTSRAAQLTSDALRTLRTALEAGGSDALRAYLDVTARFHTYSFRNTLLIGTQCPTATRVAGFHAWRQLGRYVRKGEKGIAILAPMVGRARDEQPAADGAQPERRVFGFRVVYVFDVAQTDGAELPDLDIHPGGSDPADVAGRLIDWARAHGLTVERATQDTMSGAHADCDGSRIRLGTHLTGAALAGALAHELGHAILHCPGPVCLDLGRPADRGVRELEAEAVAYVVCSVSGFTHTDRLADYILGWHGSAERLESSVARIQAACRTLLPVCEVARA